jgi:hypothetical protein
MNIIQHIKIVTPDVEAVETFLREVSGLPEGFAFEGYGSSDPQGRTQPRAKEQPAGPELTWDDIAGLRGSSGQAGFISGSTASRQLQILPGETPGVWAIAIGTRDLEGAYAKCKERGLPMTEMDVTDFAGQKVRAFFVIVGGLTFEFMRVEPI